MNTPAHLILGATVFGKPGRPGITTAAVTGALIPDLSLYLMVSWSIYVQNVPARIVFDQYYFSDAWQQVFAVDNSFVLWGLAVGFALWRKSQVLIALTGAALLHLATDFPLHHDDARRHFWPISNWVFESPISYWDNRHYGNIIGPLETTISLSACLWLWFRHTSLWGRCIVVCAALAQLAPILIWARVFSGG